MYSEIQSTGMLYREILINRLPMPQQQWALSPDLMSDLRTGKSPGRYFWSVDAGRQVVHTLAM